MYLDKKLSPLSLDSLKTFSIRQTRNVQGNISDSNNNNKKKRENEGKWKKIAMT